MDTIDLMPADKESFKFRLRRMNYDADETASVLSPDAISQPLYAAYNINTPDTVVNDFREALKAMGSISLPAEETIN